MTRFANDMYRALSDIPGVDVGEVRKAARARQVRQMWAQLVEQPILDHTNGVYVFSKDGRRQMHVYMDESIYAAELNNRRELLKLECADRFGEHIDDFCIHISKGKYKGLHPFKTEEKSGNGTERPQPLSEDELLHVEESVKQIPDARLREHFKRAMIRDMEWKKGSAAATTPQNGQPTLRTDERD